MNSIFKRKLLVAFFGIFFCISSKAEAKNFGLGIMLGQPSGVTAIYTFDMHRAVDFTLSYDFSRNFDSFLFMGDYLFRKPESIRIDTLELGWYWGVGLFYAHFSFGNRFANQFFEYADRFVFGPRIPIGLYYAFPKVPIEVFLELGFGISVIPSVSFNPTGGIGGRFFF